MDVNQIDIELNNSVILNYVIMKKILDYLNWQDLKIVKTVCQFWCDIVKSMKKNCMPQIFYSFSSKRPSFNFVLSHDTAVEPLISVSFHVSEILKLMIDCNKPTTTLRKELSCKHDHCFKRHHVLEYINSRITYPYNRMVAIKSKRIFYIPTNENKKVNGGQINLSGFCIPKINNVLVHIIDVPKNKCIFNAEQNFAINRIVKIMETEIVKCLLIFACENNNIHENNFIELFLSVVNNSQGEQYPFAAGGCIVKDTTIENFVECNYENRDCLTILVFTVPKDKYDDTVFDCYSVVFNEENTSEIDAKMKEMSNCIPKRQYNIGIKLTCFQRINLHDIESKTFTKYFPNTALIGCDAMGEIGIDCLPPNKSDDSEGPEKKKKRSNFETNIANCIHAYSTILMMLTWD